MSFIKSVCLFSLVLCAATTNFAQIEPAATPVRTTSRPPLLSVTLRQKFEKLSPDSPTTREHREEAFVNLLEAQKFILLGRRAGTQSALIGNVRLAKNSLLKAVECDPNLAEAYTALAEVTIIIPPNDIDDAIGLASIATGINKNNLGGHR